MKSDRFGRNRFGRSSLARLGIAVAIATIGAAASPAPAAAQTPGHVGAALGTGTVIIGGQGSPGKAVPLLVYGAGAVNPTVTLDFAGLDGVAEATVSDERCQAVAGTSRVACALPDTAGFSDLILVVFRAVDGVEDGAEGSISYTTSADNVRQSQNYPVKVTVRDGIDLVAFDGKREPVRKKPGDKYAAPVQFANLGNAPAEGVELLVWFSHGILPEEYENCEYLPREGSAGTMATCQLDGVFAPDGSTYYIPDGFKTRIAPDALGTETVDFLVMPAEGLLTMSRSLKSFQAKDTDGDDATDGKDATDGGDVTYGNDGNDGNDGKKLALHVRPAKARTPAGEIDARDNWGADQVDVDNVFDLAAIGADLTGAVGDEIAAEVGVQNVGAGAFDGSRSGTGGPAFTVAVPAGAEVVATPEECASLVEDNDGVVHSEQGKAGGTYYRCTSPTPFLGSGETYLIRLTLKIKSLDAAPGTVSLDDKYRVPVAFDDDNNANNTAEITLRAPASGGGGGDNASGGDNGDDGQAGVSLPITGGQAGTIAAAGLAMVAFGVVLLLSTRLRVGRLR